MNELQTIHTTHPHPLPLHQQQRLSLLQAAWAQSQSGTPPSPLRQTQQQPLTLEDLMLMLQHFGPLQASIRSLCAGTNAPAHAPAQQPSATSAHAAPLVAQELEQARQRISALESELRDTQQDLSNCTGHIQTWQQKHTASQTQLADAQHALDTLQREQQTLAAELASLKTRSQPSPELQLLRQDAPLASSMGLDPLPADDTQALIQVVAVLSQQDNLKRLWDVLKDRCETEQRAVSPAEQALLASAMAWHNHNWHDLPYTLLAPHAGERYDYNLHVRSRRVTKGETVAELCLPGLLDGAQKIFCKALILSQ